MTTSSVTSKKMKWKVTDFRISKHSVPDSNPKGSFNATFVSPYVYIASPGFVTGYYAKTLSPFVKLSVSNLAGLSNPGVAMQAKGIFNQTRLIVILDSYVTLFNNDNIQAPKLLTFLNLKETTIDFVNISPPVKHFSETILYVLTQEGLATVQCTSTSLTLKQKVSFAANLNAGLLLESRLTALYVTAVTHGNIYVFDITKRSKPKLRKTLKDDLYPVDMTQTSYFPDLLVAGGIFGITFYDVTDPLLPTLIQKRPSPYLNLIRFLPGTPNFVNALFLPTNKLVVGKIRMTKKQEKNRPKYHYHYHVSKKFPPLRIQFGRLPWDVEVIPLVSKKQPNALCQKFTVLVTNSTEPKVNIGHVRVCQD